MQLWYLLQPDKAWHPSDLGIFYIGERLDSLSHQFKIGWIGFEQDIDDRRHGAPQKLRGMADLQ